jgi:hypothetical protein
MLNTTSIQIKKELHDRLKKHCNENGLKLQWLVEMLIKKELDDTKEKN